MDIVKLLSILVLISNFIAVIAVSLFLLNKFGIYKKAWGTGKKFIEKHSLQILLLVSGVATLGSLYFSEIRGFTPCRLCWFQRIFMYPMPVLFLVAIYKKTKDVFLYSLPLSLIGLLIAGYHYYLQLHPNPYAPCGDIGFSVSCSQNFFTDFGYITIPWMSFSAFFIIFSVSLLMIKNKKI